MNYSEFYLAQMSWHKSILLWWKYRRLSSWNYIYKLIGSLYSTMLGVVDYSKGGEELVCKEGTSLLVSECSMEGITEGIMLGPIEVSIEFSSLGKMDGDPILVKEWPLFWFKDNIEESDKLLNTAAYTESISDGIRVDIFKWNSEGIIIGLYDDATLCLSSNKCLVLLIL